MPEARYKRVLLKLSGEALSGQHRYGIHNPTLTKIAKRIKRVVGMGVSVAIVVGGAISGGALRRSATASTMPTPGRIPKLGSSRGQPISRC